MKYTSMNKFLLICFALCAFTACTDDLPIDSHTPDAMENIFSDGYSLNFVATLDNMGEMATRADGENPMEEMENYIDPEKFRVLFFECIPGTKKDLFLFESRSRWIKKLDGNENRWLVSVPLFTYGNDYYYDERTGTNTKEWDWERIRTALTTNNFKIALLVNHPEYDWYPSFKDLTTPARWMDNTGPHWGPDDTGVKDVFDLHHCQYDAVYHGKSEPTGYYDFIMGEYDRDEKGGQTTNYDNQRPKMGATSSWVTWLDEGDHHGWGKRPTRLPDKDYPIPMYGIQEFNAITQDYSWRKGTPFNLSIKIPGDELDEKNYNKKSISLLRSVVKVELRIPITWDTQKPNFVGLCYANIYARCEPMDVWTPTDELWEKQHGPNNNQCEFYNIRKYGPIALKGTGGYDEYLPDDNTDQYKDVSKRLYQRKLSWFYGIWKEKGWDQTNSQFRTAINSNNNTNYPRIFNPCIQRNTVIICDDHGDLSFGANNNSPKYSYDGYYHYVAYVGERNLNDPSQLQNIASTAGGHPTVMYWIFNIGDRLYGLPITDYRRTVNGRQNPVYPTGNNKYTGKPRTLYEEYFVYGNVCPEKNGFMNGDNGYASVIYKEKADTLKYAGYSKDGYQQLIMQKTGADADILPWPLLRNHVYRLTLTASNTTPGDPYQQPSTRGGEDDAPMFEIKMDDFHAESLKID